MDIEVDTHQGPRRGKERFPFSEAGLVQALCSLRQEPATVACGRDDDILLMSWADGWYTVSAMVSGRCSFVVGDPWATDEVTMIIGGVWTRIPCRYLVPADRALRAARHFVAHGELIDREEWDGDPR